jgi:hypothetical protein
MVTPPPKLCDNTPPRKQSGNTPPPEVMKRDKSSSSGDPDGKKPYGRRTSSRKPT